MDAAVISNAPKRIACFGPFLLFLGALVALLRLSDNGATFPLSELCIVLLLRCHAVSSAFFPGGIKRSLTSRVDDVAKRTFNSFRDI